MRRFQALLMAVGLAAMPVSAAAGPSDKPHSQTPTFERFEWSTSKARLGVMVMGLTPELRTHYGATEREGVLVARVEAGTPAAAAGIQVGDVIVGVHGRPIDEASDVVAVLADFRKGQKIGVELVRDKQPRAIDVTITDDPIPTAFDGTWWGMDWIREMMKPLSAAPRRS